MDDNELISPGESGNLGESGPKLKINGANHVEDVNDKLLEEVVASSSVTGSSSLTSLPAAVNKRQGLKKWRRIPRELAKKSGSNYLNAAENGNLTTAVMSNLNREFAVRADSDGSSRSSAAASDPGSRNEMSSLNDDISVSVLPDDHGRNGRVGSGKKARAGFGTEKENGNENSGSSNFVFVQGSDTVASRGRQSGAFAGHDEESGEAESDDVSLAGDNIEKHEGSMEQDPLVESIKGLHSAQEEFERELEKWRDVGKDDPLIIYNDPMREIIELKDAKILELELALSSGGVKTDLEDCLMKIIQADVENVVITTTSKILTEGPLREIKRSLQEKNVSSQGVQATDDMSETKEDLKKLQHRVCRYSSCFMIQLMVLLVTLFLKFSPQNVEVVPT